MKIYLAPLEGITTAVFRRAVHDSFGEGISKYFAPFISPNEKKDLSKKEKKQLLPENNPGQILVPQILTNVSHGYLVEEIKLKAYGYKEINLNLGCPSKTVTGRGRGAGFLKTPDAVEKFLDEIFKESTLPVSVKTRLGWQDCEEFERLLTIYNRFPLEELIVHTRVGVQAYQGKADHSWFDYAMNHSKHSLCYNGDLNTKEDLEELIDHLGGKEPDSIMIGRGMVADPSLIRQLSGGPAATPEETFAFLERLLADYANVLEGGEIQILYKMKEIWSYMGRRFPNKDRLVKKLMKSRSLDEYRLLTREILL